MKNLIYVNTYDVKDYVNSLWVSDIFKNGGEWLEEQINLFAKLPRFFCDMTSECERFHFSTWWNVITHRTYDNPYIQDLYYLHEIVHANTMPYVKNMTFAGFCEKMQRNELEASVFSEILVYFYENGLREHTFDKEIYVDRFLDRKLYHNMWDFNKTMMISVITTMRRNIMIASDTDGLDDVEKWINKFSMQNDKFAETWKNDFNIVETHMCDFFELCIENENLAIENHMKWLYDNSENDIPFLENAMLFNYAVIDPVIHHTPVEFDGMGFNIFVRDNVGIAAFPMWNCDSKLYKKSQLEKNKKKALDIFNRRRDK